jgi:hypothetical protein
MAYDQCELVSTPKIGHRLIFNAFKDGKPALKRWRTSAVVEIANS